jgi:septum formation protein
MNHLSGYKIILASNSPRRQQLLRQMGVTFDIKVRPVDEGFPDNLPQEEVALYLSRKKAMAFGDDELGSDILIITADTIVCRGDEILNKPENEDHAREMLQKLSAEKHTVITGVTLRSGSKLISFSDATDVYFKALNKNEIDYYITHYKPFDKAGAYGIQEWIGLIGIEKIEGAYTNVVGLPTARLFDELMRF